ncbi:MAG: LysR family transcriptional regulator [Opitutales bacterium]
MIIIDIGNDVMLEIRHFRLLTQLAESGNLARSGKALNLSQPAVSRQMSDIEEHCGGEVFERKSSPIHFTPLGFRLLETAYTILNELNETDRDLHRIRDGSAGTLRVGVECHSCFDWLMPSMDAFRVDWPEVAMDLVSGFHGDPVGLLTEDAADLVLVSHSRPKAGVKYHPLFRYEVLALLPHGHPLLSKRFLTARDFAGESLVTYPLPDERLDILREVLNPAGVAPRRRTTELTIAILQLVASGRGIATLPGWAVQPYLERNYVAARPVRKNGLHTNFYMATRRGSAQLAYMQGFIELNRTICFANLEGIEAIV